MNRMFIGCLVAALLLVPASSRAQSPPDLSGTWKIDLGRSVAGGGGDGRGTGQGTRMGGGLGLGPSPDALVITQDATGLVIEEHWSTGSNRLTLTFDGKDTKNMAAVGRGGPGMVAFYRSVWKKNRLVTTYTIDAPRGGFPRRYEEVRYLDKDGSLIVETTAAGSSGSRKSVYRKS